MRRRRDFPAVLLPNTPQDKPKTQPRFILLGCSAGGYSALTQLLQALHPNFSTPTLVVQHLPKEDAGGFASSLQHHTHLTVITPDDKTTALPQHLYVAPANYHMLLSPANLITLNVDEPVLGSRPSIDILFSSGAIHYKQLIAAIILTGANTDGTNGIRSIALHGGTTLAQDPNEAEFPLMPRSAIQSNHVQHTGPIRQLAQFLNTLTQTP
jgi:two-component system chemotaxis response regulator CheB